LAIQDGGNLVQDIDGLLCRCLLVNTIVCHAVTDFAGPMVFLAWRLERWSGLVRGVCEFLGTPLYDRVPSLPHHGQPSFAGY